MSASIIVLVVLAVGVVGFGLSYARACSIEWQGKKMHSRPYYYGWWTFLITVIPSILMLILWDTGSAIYLEQRASQQLADNIASGKALNHSLALSTIDSLTHAFSMSQTDIETFE